MLIRVLHWLARDLLPHRQWVRWLRWRYEREQRPQRSRPSYAEAHAAKHNYQMGPYGVLSLPWEPTQADIDAIAAEVASGRTGGVFPRFAHDCGCRRIKSLSGEVVRIFHDSDCPFGAAQSVIRTNPSIRYRQ